MADIFSKEKRSKIMSGIRAKNTKAELIVFRFLRQRRVYFQKHYGHAPGKPDIALPSKKLAIFIDGDFWHGKTLDQLKLRRENPDKDYWVLKIMRNMERDCEQELELLRTGWRVLRIWEGDILRKSTRDACLHMIAEFIVDGRKIFH